MNTIARRAYNLCRSPPLLPVQGVKSVSGEHQIQQCRGIRVRVHNGNLEQALKFMQRKMQSSGIERQIKNLQTHHVKNSEKRVLARKKLQRRIQSQELAHRIKSIHSFASAIPDTHISPYYTETRAKIVCCTHDWDGSCKQYIKKSVMVEFSLASARSRWYLSKKPSGQCGQAKGLVRKSLKYPSWCRMDFCNASLLSNVVLFALLNVR
ncbi:RIBOSOMAL PROTEIN S21 FAMILY PROTEIN [Salix viminalis]|uniref:RIBOSOMAL PROTEIN S21 FAMILY PROTEIN n=1 Tax=Salix viminalis TaxID=40686 RepID=A0A9Q0U226_SALVM|nr:RIBOSOMAL PROTEIN S21 FAMILY PROTEIN [Salix viminalis]